MGKYCLRVRSLDKNSKKRLRDFDQERHTMSKLNVLEKTAQRGKSDFYNDTLFNMIL